MPVDKSAYISIDKLIVIRDNEREKMSEPQLEYCICLSPLPDLDENDTLYCLNCGGVLKEDEQGELVAI